MIGFTIYNLTICKTIKNFFKRGFMRKTSQTFYIVLPQCGKNIIAIYKVGMTDDFRHIIVLNSDLLTIMTSDLLRSTADKMSNFSQGQIY